MGEKAARVFASDLIFERPFERYNLGPGSKRGTITMSAIYTCRERKRVPCLRVCRVHRAFQSFLRRPSSGHIPCLHSITSLMSDMTRAVLVTGANQGLGYHTVHQLAQTPGMIVFLGSRRMPAGEEAAAKIAPDVHPTSSVIPVHVDLADEKTILAASEFVAAKLGEKGISKLDCLVNNAATAVGPATEIFAVNVAGTLAVKTAFYPLIKPGGEIMNISSSFGSHGLRAARPYTLPPAVATGPPYSASKAAINNLTLQWAWEEEQKKTGIRVVSICPGLNATTMSRFSKAGVSPAVGCAVMVNEVLQPQGKSGIFFDKDGPIPW
ncbi:unnamed protein product [Mycena citricolor]|uniref:NAD(P)-binding protein n=1 Tax=Mycena citricolor TaxID=2018698 RepID=A0AAD2HX44_9AGAR|nr:unnamed protein product [Mycena citricolor]